MFDTITYGDDISRLIKSKTLGEVITYRTSTQEEKRYSVLRKYSLDVVVTNKVVITKEIWFEANHQI